MRKVLLFISLICGLSIILFVVFTSAYHSSLTDSEALEIGEEKYLEFLWMVDGAFNSERFDGEFTVNGKTLDDSKKEFTCVYKRKNDESCIGNNFEKAFHNLFASNVTYNRVYSDGAIYTWFKYEKGNYIFTNSKSCSVKRMNLQQKIKLVKILDNELSFDVSDDDSVISCEFILIKENGNWKVGKALYKDLCEMSYVIQ